MYSNWKNMYTRRILRLFWSSLFPYFPKKKDEGSGRLNGLSKDLDLSSGRGMEESFLFLAGGSAFPENKDTHFCSSGTPLHSYSQTNLYFHLL